MTVHNHRCVGVWAIRRGARRARRGAWWHGGHGAFTLFEMILAIALSVALVSLIGTAINLYLTRVDRSRTQVEEAQLARALLAKIADDLRAATIYQPQDVSTLAQLVASGTPFDVDSIDQPSGSGGGGAGGASTGASGTGGSTGSGAGTSGGSGSSSGSGTSLGTQSNSSLGGETDLTMPLGLNGTLEELYVDATRLPRREELFATITGYTNAPTGMQADALATGTGTGTMASLGPLRPNDLKTVRYFIRQGQSMGQPAVATSTATPTLPGAEPLVGGLVRQEIPRLFRVWAEQTGNSAVLESGQTLLAPEVAHIEFRYFDGTEVAEYWDMQERGLLPLAIEIRLWIIPADARDEFGPAAYDPAALAQTAHEYRQTVYLPMSQVGGGASGTSGAASGTDSESASGTSTGTTGGSGGSTFDQF